MGERGSPAAVRITAEVEDAIHELCELAPLHNLAGLEGIRAIGRVLPSVPQVAVFDTAFHATLPAAARTYAIPRTWTTEWGIHRYGFHGLSHAYCSRRAAAMLGRSSARIVIAHLGNGASVSAVRNGVCVDTSMGFTPLEGVVMGTRSGSVDPGALLYLLQHKGLTVEQLLHVFNYESGLLGLSGISSDMREILKKAPGILRPAWRWKSMSTGWFKLSARWPQRLAGLMDWSSRLASARIRRKCGSWSAKTLAIWGWNSTPPPTPAASPMRTSPSVSLRGGFWSFQPGRT